MMAAWKPRAWSLLGLGLGLLGCAPEPAPAIRPEEFRQTLARVKSGVPAPMGMEELSCPDAEILGWTRAHATTGLQGQPVLALGYVTYESLARYADEGPTTLERPGLRLMPTREELGLEPEPDTGPDDWFWLEGLALRTVFHPNLYEGYHREADLQHEMRGVLGRRYLLVLRSSTRHMPRIRGGGVEVGFRRKELHAGGSFAPGAFQGGLFVVDIQAARVVCQAPLEAESSASLTYTTSGPFRGQPSAVLRSDFRDRFRDAARASLGRISKLVASPW